MQRTPGGRPHAADQNVCSCCLKLWRDSTNLHSYPPTLTRCYHGQCSPVVDVQRQAQAFALVDDRPASLALTRNLNPPLLRKSTSTSSTRCGTHLRMEQGRCRVVLALLSGVWPFCNLCDERLPARANCPCQFLGSVQSLVMRGDGDSDTRVDETSGCASRTEMDKPEGALHDDPGRPAVICHRIVLSRSSRTPREGGTSHRVR